MQLTIENSATSNKNSQQPIATEKTEPKTQRREFKTCDAPIANPPLFLFCILKDFFGFFFAFKTF
jgi:hypothetical protein